MALKNPKENLFFAMLFFLVATAFVLVSSCKRTHAMSLFKDHSAIEVTPVPTPTPGLDGAAARAKLLDMSVNSLCAKTIHGDVKNSAGKITYGSQGTPPPGFMRGIALTAARAACAPESAWVKVASQPVGSAAKDFIAHYGLNGSTPEARFDLVMSLMVGSAARESSWRWCVGKDPGATNTSSETCEAGLYQTSYNSRSGSAVLPALFTQYRKDSTGCFAVEYKGKTTCSASNLKNYGVGADGVEFQRLTKQCPGFATEYHAVMVRVQRSHYGPINQKGSQIKVPCTSLFSDVRKFVQDNPSVCAAL